MKLRVLPILGIVALAVSALAQEMPGAEGPTTGPVLGDGPHPIATTTAAARRTFLAARRVALPTIDKQPLLDEDALVASMPALRIDPRVGVTRWFHQFAAPRRLSAGAPGVTAMDDGSLVWSAEIGSPGAVGLRIHLSRFELPAGATLVVYDADEPSEAYGPFVGDALPTNARRTGERFLPTVFGAAARIEIRVPAASLRQPMFVMADRVVHRYRERAAGHEDPRVGVPTKAGACENDVVCDADYVQDVARGVATMEISSSDGNVYLCSGALMNDADPLTNIPYFLTAHHCVESAYEANHTEFYFDFRAATCGGAAPKLVNVPRVSGATLLSTSSSSDYSLLKLASLPANRFFCGWTGGRQNTGESVVGVHHPGGAKMAISYGTMLDPDGNFHQVQWSSGVTAPGSSGSPLFNPQKQVIGQLYGGSSSCSLKNGIDEYGRFDKTWPYIRTWLGDGPVASTSDIYDPADDVQADATLLVPNYFDQSHGPHSLSKTDAADWFAFDLGGGAHYRFFSTGVDDVSAVLYSDQLGSVVAAENDDSAGTKQFSVDFVPAVTGRYWLKVTSPDATAGVEYTLYYTQARTNWTKAPAPVRGLKRTLAGTIVKLKWTDAARNESGYYVDVSLNGGQDWTRAGELPRNARAFSHDPGPGKRLYRVGAWNEASVVRWRQIAVTIVDPNQMDGADPGDDEASGATPLESVAAGATPTHTLSRADEQDWYRVELEAGHSYLFQTTGAGDTYGELFADEDGEEIVAFNPDSGPGRNFRIVYRSPTTASYWLRVTPKVDGAILDYVLQWRRH